jgi:hypothetical protein
MSREPADTNVCATFKPRGERRIGKGRQGNVAVDEGLSRNNVAQTFLSASFDDFPVASHAQVVAHDQTRTRDKNVP